MNFRRLDAPLDSTSGQGVGQLRADSVLLGHQRLRRHHGGQGNTGSTSASKVQPASLALQDGDGDGGVSVGCWCLGGGDVYRGAGGGGGGRGSRLRASSAPVAAGSRRPLTGTGGRSADDFPKAQHGDSDSDLDDDDDELPALAMAFRSFRSSLMGWSSRMRLRLLGGSSRLVFMDGVPYPLRTHLKTNKPKRSALRGSTPHSVSCPGRIEDGGHGASWCAPSSRDGASLAVKAPCKKKLRFAISVLDTGDGSGGGSETEVDVVGGVYDSAASEQRKKRGGEGDGGGDGDDGSGSFGSDDGRGRGGGSEAGACGGATRGSSGDVEVGTTVQVRAEAPAAQESPPLTPDASSAATAAAAAATASVTAAATEASFSRQRAGGEDTRGTEDAAGSGSGAGTRGPSDTAAATTAAAAAATSSLPPGGRQPSSSSRKLLLRGGPSAGGPPVRPGTPPSPLPTPPSPPRPSVPLTAERARQLASSAGGPAVNSVLAPPLPPADAAAAAAALAARPPSLIARLLQGVRDSGSSGTSNGSAPPPLRVSPSGASSQFSADSDSDAAVTAVTAVSPQQYPQPAAAPPPKPGRYHSVQLIRNALFEPEPPQPSQPQLGGGGGGGVGGFSQRSSRVVSYTSPGTVGGPHSSQALGAPPHSRGATRRQFLPDPSPPAPHGQRQRQQRQKGQEEEEGGGDEAGVEALTEEDERLAAAAAGKLRQRRIRRLEQQAARAQGPGQRGPLPAASSPQRWVTSVRPIGDDVGDDVRDAAVAAAADDDCDDDAGAFNWLEALRKTRSATERCTFAATETCRSADDADAGADGVEDAVDLLRHLTHGRNLAAPAGPPPLLTAVGPAPVVRAGRRGVRPHAVDGLSFSDLSFSVQRAVQAVQGNAAARGKPLQPMPPAAAATSAQQQQQQQMQQQRQLGVARGDGNDSTSAAAAAAAATAANERSRRIRAAPFAAAMGLLTPPPPPPTSGPRVDRTVSDRSGSVRWQLQPPPRQQQRQSSQRSSVDQPTSSSTATAAAAAPDAASSAKRASNTGVAARAGFALVPESPSAPWEQSPPISAPAVLVGASAAQAAAAARSGRAERLRLEAPEVQNSNLYGSGCGDGGAGGGADGVLDPLVITSPGAAAIGSMLGPQQQPRRLGPGGAAAPALDPAPVKPLLALPSGLRPPCSSSGQGRGRHPSVAGAAVTAPPAELAVADLALAPLNTPAIDPWVEERCALAGSGTPYADMAASLAQTLAARLDMTSSGVSSSGSGSGSGSGRGRTPPASQNRSMQFSAPLGLMQQQQHLEPQRLRTAVEVCCSPSSDGNVAEVDSPAAATAAAAACFSRGGGGGGGGGYVAARAAAQREAVRVSRGSLQLGPTNEVSVPGAAGGGLSRRGDATANGFQLPGGTELVEGCSVGGVVAGCRDSGAAGGAEGFTAAANGITAGGAVLSLKGSIVRRVPGGGAGE